MIIDSFEILDDNGWDLMKELPDMDYKFSLSKFPANYLCGIKTKYKENTYTTSYHKPPKVTLKISTWKGICSDAIHYNGQLIIDLPDMQRDDKAGYTVGCWDIPIFKNDKINLTTIITQFEKDKYPSNYDFWDVGDHHKGFFTVKSVELAGKDLFDRIFEDGWIFKINSPFK
jgi:hypothetical protein